MYQFNRDEYEKRMEWYRDARFGMFIHWGLYSIPARGEWIRSTEEMMQDMGNPFSPIPFQTVQIIPDGVVAILVGNDADGGFDLLLAENAVLLHSP